MRKTERRCGDAGKTGELLFKCNPMYWMLYFIRRIVLYHTVPEINTWLYCFVFGFGFLVLGLGVFKKNQDKFIYYA